jgi:predicted RNA binding protein YcfA (HicA-like mRNA interferase family)
MSQWPSSKAARVLAALQRIGWQIKRQSGSHRTLSRQGWLDFVFAFHDRDEIGPRVLARIAKHTGLRPEELSVFAMLTPNQAHARPTLAPQPPE